MEWNVGWFCLVLAALILGLIGGFFGARAIIKKEIQKNPPINEQMIKGMMMQMGRKPSQKQINQMMKSMRKYMD